MKKVSRIVPRAFEWQFSNNKVLEIFSEQIQIDSLSTCAENIYILDVDALR